MPVVNITLTNAQLKLLTKLAYESGKSLSGMAAECIDIGMDLKCESANKRAVFLSMEGKRESQRVMLDEELTDEDVNPRGKKGK